MSSDTNTYAMSVYRAGASDGYVMGAWLSVCFLLQAYGIWTPALLLLGDLMMLASPLPAYLMMRRAFLKNPARSTFSALWMHGILIFLCGSLILALVMYVFLRWIQPFYIVNIINMMIDSLDQINDDNAIRMTRVLRGIIQQKMVPTPISMAFTSVWFGGFFGSIVSIALAWLVRLVPVKS